jgi:asparagine synthase (glutamine-hydrolysing)
MCGIIGAIGDFDNKDLQQYGLSSIQHRGPDDMGVWCDKKAFLGHARLSIIETSSLGHQPMVSDDGRFIIIFNGEIYNHQDLRKALLAVGYKFNSNSDTETLLKGLIHAGIDFIKQLNGIFSFAFYDVVERKMILARDHFGVKPLYYTITSNCVLFSSEAKALLPFVDKLNISAKNLLDYLTFLWCPGEGTPVDEIKKMLPGHYAILTAGKDEVTMDMHRYYDIPYKGIYKFNSEKETIDVLDEKIQQAVKRQLLSDVPVGFFLSGGLDSSLVVAVAQKFVQQDVQCFTIDAKIEHPIEGFEDDLFYAKKVASSLCVNLEVVKADIDIVRDFDKMIWHLDEPQADAAPLNVLNICNRASAMGYKVLLGGAAGDDLFSGYRRHQALGGENYFKLIPSFLIRAILSLPINVRITFFRRLMKVAHQLDKPIEQRLANYYCWMPSERAKDLFTKDYQQKIGSYHSTDKLFQLLHDIPEEGSWLNKMLYWEMKAFLVDHNLNYTDKMGMAKGVEIRVPYLDVGLVNFACTINPSLKMKAGETKYILKKVAERYLPKEVIYRSKTGFGAPVRKWILEDLNEMISERLSKQRISSQGVFDGDKVWKLIEENKEGRIDASYSIWSLLAVDSWITQFLKQPLK